MSTMLRSDHVNYLIWRYLQEHGYGRSAVQLMRDWHDNPQDLPFASSVKDHTLVALLQDGIAYDGMQAAATKNGIRYSFVEVKVDERKRPASSDFDNINEFPRESMRGPRKRPKLGMNGTNGVEEPHSRARSKAKRTGSSKRRIDTNDDAMNVDAETPSRIEDDNESHIEAELVEAEPPVLVTTAEIGTDAEVQTEKLIEKPVAKSICDLRIPGADIVHLDWHPSDPTKLSAAGGSIWRTWTIPTSQVTGDVKIQPEFRDSGPQEKEFYVTAATRSPANKGMAMAVEQGEERTLVLGSDTTPLSWHDQSTVLAFRWDPSSDLLLAASVSSNIGGIVSIWRTDELIDVGEFTPVAAPMDACWTKDSHFIVCGDHFIDFFRATDSVRFVSSVPTELPWEKIRYDELTNKVALVSPEDGQLGSIDLSAELLQCEVTAAHDGQITGLEWQPMGPSAFDNSLSRILATSSTDGTVKLWDARRKPVCIHSFLIEPSIPVMAMKFSPDGLFLACGGDKKINIWKAQPEGQLTAIWYGPRRDEEQLQPIDATRKQGLGISMEPNGHSEVDEPYHTLSWNSEGLKLAYACGDQVHIIDLRGQRSLA